MKRFSVFTIMFSIIILVFGCSSDEKTLKISPSSIKFADVNLGDVVTFDLTLTNKYGKLIIITAISIAGSNDFTITAGNAVPISLDKNAIHTVTVKFEPTTGGPLAAMLSILHDASTKPKEVNLTGNGIPVPRIKLSPTTYDFDKKLINRTHTHDFEIENIGTSVLNINNFNFTGAGASAYSISAGNAPVQIQPAQKHTFTISFAPTVVGVYDSDLEVHHNAVNSTQPSIITVTGEAIDVDPQITLSQSSPWDFGSVATTMPSTQICEIENTGIDPLTVTSATLAIGTAFTIASLKDSNGNVINFPQVIAIGAKIMLAIKFTPTANTTYNDTLTFVHDGTNEVTPWDIPLAGEGRGEISKTFTYTGAAEQWTVPAGVTSIVVECFGAEAGNGYNYSAGHVPGKGGMAKASVPVTPGSTVNVYVGGKGGNGASSTPGTGGFNGGAIGGTYSSYAGGGGGGASDIRVGGLALTDRKVVGGGGGGAAYNYSSGDNGGNGGGLDGQHGASNNNYSSAYAGGGGSQTAGGTAGYMSSYGYGDVGSLGNGGKGNGGSGGGGGGGGVWAGGGGGSSYYDASGNTDKSTQTGIRSGNGEITFKY